MKNLKIAIVLGLIFFFIGLVTLPGYGINWDTINHLPRGQAYLNYFLTRQTDYSNLTEKNIYPQDPKSLFISERDRSSYRSMYQNSQTPFTWYLENDGNGHPPLSDTLAAFFNYIFFQKLHLINDIDSYRVYSIFLASVLIGLIFWWISKIYSKLAGFVASLVLGIYPLFWSEIHFNSEKDVPETVYWSLLLFCVYQGVTKKSVNWILISGIFFGLALGTKLNVIFVFLAIGLWLLSILTKNWKKGWSFRVFVKDYGSVFLSGVMAVIIGVLIFFTTWPYLWDDPVNKILGVLSFYKEIGIEENPNRAYLTIFNINTYPFLWILYTTPINILVLFIIGFIRLIKKSFSKVDRVSALFLIWFLVPILRVSAPGATIYGGVRQIMEFIPALAIICGIGAKVLYDFLVNRKFGQKALLKLIALAVIFISFIPITIKLIQIHPNENVYFNELIGGLLGAKEKQIPAWGNSFGAAYRQGIIWINDNAPKNSRVAFARELVPNVPVIWLRPDLELHNSHRSGYLKKGEYVIGLTHQGTENSSYFDRYLSRILSPVYEVKVDNVAILKVWKNDLEHTKSDYLKESEIVDYVIDKKKDGILIDLKNNYRLSKLEMDFEVKDCSNLTSGEVKLSANGQDWMSLAGKMPKEDWSVPKILDQPTKNHVIVPFAGDEGRYIKINITPEDACMKNVTDINILYFNP